MLYPIRLFVGTCQLRLKEHKHHNSVQIAPDTRDAFVATLANPLAGLGVAVKKIAEKAKEDTD